ncbi:hypothetical protein [Coleofasciculus sp. FACHB-T130]|uniref:hypothetical protein n=1 Tax=Cyanophyceae TaxID=3028117 RepID=UPI0016870634|nr:hypothetical protein [Coleofasciculus sp. FACHB-T130]
MSQNLELHSESTQSESAHPSHFVFRISPLIRITLMALYLALTIPLPFLSQASASPVPPWLLWLGIALGLVPLFGVLSERVIVDDEKIQVTYPRWVPGFFRRGWSLAWAEVKDLKLRSTGQGGIVYYFVSKSEQKAYLLPMRVVGFARLVKLVEDKTGIDTTDVRPLSQPWMYLILLVFSLLLFVTDAWTIWMATTQGRLT